MNALQWDPRRLDLIAAWRALRSRFDYRLADREEHELVELLALLDEQDRRRLLEDVA